MLKEDDLREFLPLSGLDIEEAPRPRKPFHTREVPGSIPGAPIRKALENRSFRVKPSTGTGLGEHDGERRGSESDIAPRAMRLADTQKMKRSGKACGRAAAG
jgi:hypothetical protein